MPNNVIITNVFITFDKLLIIFLLFQTAWYDWDCPLSYQIVCEFDDKSKKYFIDTIHKLFSLFIIVVSRFQRVNLDLRANFLFWTLQRKS